MSPRKCGECGQVHMTGANGAIYLCGPLLRAVQMSGMYKDSRYFVSMSCRYSPERILADFQLFSSCKKNETSIKHLTNFVDNHFDQPGLEMEYWCPPDWRCEPAFLARIKDPSLKKFGTELNAIWKQLGRSIKDCVRTSPLLYSLVYVPNPIIVGGGRSIEFYYWETYWIVRGLLYSGMHQTARGMIDNLLYLVHQYKTLPMGGRIFYWGRSHPPMLTAMVKAYVDITKDQKYAILALPLLEMEMDNFLKTHAVTVEGRTMYHYNDTSAGPRPEAYREDISSASNFAADCEKNEHFSHLKAACESGQNFSSRWYISPSGNNVGTLANIKTTWIVPVDLNCILFRNCKTLAEFNGWAGNQTNAQQYRSTACGLIKAITSVLWNEERGVWFDYDLSNKMPRDYFVVTNLSPLWLRAYPIADAEKISESVLAYINENNLDSFPGGVPHTLNNTGQQWDYPYVWPQMMYMLIEGLNNLGTPEAMEMSSRWRDRWVKSNYEMHSQTGYMFEKYNCEGSGSSAAAEETPNQTGFGWTNAVLIELLARYGQDISLGEDCPCSCTELDDCIITSEAYMERSGEEEQDQTCDDETCATFNTNAQTQSNTNSNAPAQVTYNAKEQQKKNNAKDQLKYNAKEQQNYYAKDQPGYNQPQDVYSIATSEPRCPPPLQRSNPYGQPQNDAPRGSVSQTQQKPAEPKPVQDKSAQVTYGQRGSCVQVPAKPQSCGQPQEKPAQVTYGQCDGCSDAQNKAAQAAYQAQDRGAQGCGQVQDKGAQATYGRRDSNGGQGCGQAQSKPAQQSGCGQAQYEAPQPAYAQNEGCGQPQSNSRRGSYGQAQDKGAQATYGRRDSNGGQGCGQAQSKPAQQSCCGQDQNEPPQPNYAWAQPQSKPAEPANEPCASCGRAQSKKPDPPICDSCARAQRKPPPEPLYTPCGACGQAIKKPPPPPLCDACASGQRQPPPEPSYEPRYGCGQDEKKKNANNSDPPACDAFAQGQRQPPPEPSYYDPYEEPEVKPSQANTEWCNQDQQQQQQQQQAYYNSGPVDACSICGCECEQIELPPNMEPIQIEVDATTNVLDISDSQAEELRSTYPCPSVVSEDDGPGCDDECSCGENEDAPSPAIPPPPAPVLKNKIFPLADGKKCPLPKPAEEPEPEGCACDKAASGRE